MDFFARTLLLIFLLMNWMALDAQDRIENPFQGKSVVIITDGSEIGMRCILLQLQNKDNELAYILSTGADWEKEKKMVEQLSVACGINIPYFPSGYNQLPTITTDFICLSLVAPDRIPEEVLALDHLIKIIVYKDNSGNENPEFLNERRLFIDWISPLANLEFTGEEWQNLSKLNTCAGKEWKTVLDRGSNTRLTSELLIIYLLFPEVFDMKQDIEDISQTYCKGYDPSMIKIILPEILEGQYRTGEGVAFAGFPMEPTLYQYDVRLMMEQTILNYGVEEWKACVLTDEIHGHLGIYSVLGAKMGIRAREYFNVGTDKIKVTSLAGSQPPVSCLNDGLQSSTGATVGQGTILIQAGQELVPAAIFEYGGRKIRIDIKGEYKTIIENDIRSGIVQYGLMNAGYWKLVRKIALKYWSSWNRNEIFIITEL